MSHKYHLLTLGIRSKNGYGNLVLPLDRLELELKLSLLSEQVAYK